MIKLRSFATPFLTASELDSSLNDIFLIAPNVTTLRVSHGPKSIGFDGRGSAGDGSYPEMSHCLQSYSTPLTPERSSSISHVALYLSEMTLTPDVLLHSAFNYSSGFKTLKRLILGTCGVHAPTAAKNLLAS
eukprot:6704384-Prymnesium_polylepis.1